MNDLDAYALAFMVPISYYAMYKIGYWTGRKDGVQWAMDELRNLMTILKKIGEELHAKQNGKV